MINIFITMPFACQAIVVIDTLKDHAQLGRFFNAKFKCLTSPNQEILRQVTLRGHTFIEKIDFSDAHTIEYHIEGQGPVKNHQARIWATPLTTGCQLHYSIQCQALNWQPSWLVKLIIKHDISRALAKLRAYCDGR